jgi:hypothetical protein
MSERIIVSAIWSVFMMRLEEFTECSEELEHILEKERRHLKERADAIANFSDPDGDFSQYEEAADDWDKLDKAIPSVIRGALFVRTVSEFEMILTRVAKRHITAAKMKFTLSDLRDDGLRKVKSFFEKFTDQAFPTDAEQWEEITKLADLRNIVLHNESRIPEEKLKSFARFDPKWKPAISWDNAGRVQFGPTAISFIVPKYCAFLKALSRGIKTA